jgi:hypothetical protein
MNDYDDSFELVFSLMVTDPDFDIFDNPYIEMVANTYSEGGSKLDKDSDIKLDHCSKNVTSASYM